MIFLGRTRVDTSDERRLIPKWTGNRIYQVTLSRKGKHLYTSRGMPDQAISDYFSFIQTGERVSFTTPCVTDGGKYFRFTKPQLRRIRRECLLALQELKKPPSFQEKYELSRREEIPTDISSLLSAIDEVL